MDQEEASLRERTKASGQIFEKIKRSVPKGVNSNYRFVDPYPLYFRRGKGSRLWDCDGNGYVDFNMAFGALVVGHAHPLLVEAVKQRVEDGTILGFEAEETVELVDLLSSRFRVDMVRLSSTGAEATMYAVRLARAYTGRNKIVKFEGCYHGSHDSLLVSVKPPKDKVGHPRHPAQVPSSLGVPQGTIKETLVAPFNDAEALETLVSQNAEDIAGIIVEPIPMNMGFVLPEDNFLQAIRGICNAHGLVLIFDEVKTCGKFYRGAASHFAVRPDLVTLGKAIGGGYPISAVCGKRDIMETIVPGKLSHAGTFNANSLSVVAAAVTLRDILTESAFSKISKLGEDLGRGYRDVLNDHKVPASVQYLGPSGAVAFPDGRVRNWRDFLSLDIGRWWVYYIGMLNRGIVPAGTGPDEQWTISVQHEGDDIAQHIENLKEVAPIIKRTSLELPIVEAI